MQPTMEILARISKNSNRNKEEVFTKLYRYLLRPDLYFEAYRNLYANPEIEDGERNRWLKKGIAKQPSKRTPHGYQKNVMLPNGNNRRIKAKLKGLPPALHRQQALSAA